MGINSVININDVESTSDIEACCKKKKRKKFKKTFKSSLLEILEHTYSSILCIYN